MPIDFYLDPCISSYQKWEREMRVITGQENHKILLCILCAPWLDVINWLKTVGLRVQTESVKNISLQKLRCTVRQFDDMYQTILLKFKSK